MEIPDRNLLELFAAKGDEEAFRVLVRRYLDLVHGVARRVTRNDDLARDVSQNTFIRLAQRAALIPQDVTLPAWLHRTTRSLAVDLIRQEERRKKHERRTALDQAIAMKHAAEDGNGPAWTALAPLLDELVNALPAADREVLLLRFYRNESHAAVGQKLGLTEELARKRSLRAVEKLRGILSRRGVPVTAATLASLLPLHAAPPAPGTVMYSVLTATQGIAPVAAPGFSIHLAMTSSQKLAIAAAALIFLSSAGYAIKGIVAPIADTAAVRPSPALSGLSPAGDAGVRQRPARRGAAAITAEKRLARLKEILEIPGIASRRRELMGFLGELTTPMLGEMATAMAQFDPDRLLQEERKILLSEWAQADGEGAANWCRNGQAGVDVATILTTWGEHDPQAALTWAKTHPIGDPPLGVDMVISGMAASDLPGALELIRGLPEKGAQNVVHMTVARMSDLPGGWERLIAAIKDPGLLSTTIASAAWSRPYNEQVDLLEKNEGAQQIVDVRGLFQQWIYQDPAAATARLAELKPGKFRDQALSGAVTALANQRPQDAIALVKQYADVASDGDYYQAAIGAAGSSREALEVAAQIRDETARNDALMNVMRKWQEREPEAAAQWLKTETLPESVRQQLSQPSPGPNPENDEH